MTDRSIQIVIPLASTGLRDGASVCHILAVSDAHTPVTSGGHPPTIAELAAMKLTLAGRKALDRVNMLGARRPWKRLPRLTSPRRSSSRLRPLNIHDVKNLSAENAKSAELGLALGLLALERKSKTPLIIATGELSSKAVDGISAYDSPVLPVAGLDQKFAAIGDFLENHRPLPGSRVVEVLVPRTDPDGKPVLEAHSDAIAALHAQMQTIGTRLTVTPVASLADAAARVGALRAPLDMRELGAWSAAAITAVVAAILLQSLVPLHVERTAQFNYFATGPLDTPVVWRMQEDMLLPLDEPCADETGILQMAHADRMTVRFHTEPTLWPAWSYQVMYVIVGDVSGATVFTKGMQYEENQPQRMSDGGLEFGVTFTATGEHDEEMAIGVLSRKLFPFSADDLYALLGNASAKQKDQQLNAQVVTLEQMYGNLNWQHFRTVSGEPTCSANSL